MTTPEVFLSVAAWLLFGSFLHFAALKIEDNAETKTSEMVHVLAKSAEGRIMLALTWPVIIAVYVFHGVSALTERVGSGEWEGVFGLYNRIWNAVHKFLTQ